MFRESVVEQDVGTSAAQVESESHRDQCDRLHRRLKKLVKARGGLDCAEAEALREAQKLMLWRRYGYGSLLEYMEMEMGYSPRAAIERLRVANALVDLPQVAAALEQGELSFSAAREITRVATPETEGEWIGATCDLNLRDVEEAVSGHKRGDRPTDEPDPTLKKKILRLEVTPEMFALWRQVQQAIAKEKGERLDDSAVVDVLARTYLGERAQTERDVAPYQIAVTLCERCDRGWQDGAGIVVEMSPASIERAKCDATHVGAIGAEPRAVQNAEKKREAKGKKRVAKAKAKETEAALTNAAKGAAAPLVDTTTSRAAEKPPGRKIPAALRREVKRRDHGRCQVPWCRSSINCDIHHREPWAQGGKHTLDNLITLCEAHHNALHEGALRILLENGRFVVERVVPLEAVRDQHAADTALALRGLGFKAADVAAVVERTRTHVGTQDLPLEKWVTIALSYCPSARTDRPRPS